MNKEIRHKIQDKKSIIRSWIAIRDHFEKNPIPVWTNDTDPSLLRGMFQKELDLELSQLLEILDDVVLSEIGANC